MRRATSAPPPITVGDIPAAGAAPEAVIQVAGAVGPEGAEADGRGVAEWAVAAWAAGEDNNPIVEAP